MCGFKNVLFLQKKSAIVTFYNFCGIFLNLLCFFFCPTSCVWQIKGFRRAKLFFNGMKVSHGMFQLLFFLCLADCKPKCNKYPKQVGNLLHL